jgi:DNA-binding transcriptional regulator WhiA
MISRTLEITYNIPIQVDPTSIIMKNSDAKFVQDLPFKNGLMNHLLKRLLLNQLNNHTNCSIEIMFKKIMKFRKTKL